MTLRQRFRSSEEGLSLLELLVAMVIGGVVLSLAFAFMWRSVSTEQFTDEESRSLAELRIAATRFTKEVRQARMVYVDPAKTNATSLYIWVDHDRDNQRDAAERIVWHMTGSTLTRTTASGDNAVVASGLATGSGFVYEPDPSVGHPTMVTATFLVDVEPGSLAGERAVTTAVRLRNAALTTG